MLDQAFAHCPIFPTAASRRSLGRVSVPVWLIILSDQLTIVALVSLYPTNKLIVRRLLHRRLAPLALRHHAVLAAVSRSCPPPMDKYLRVTHPSATACYHTVRLACVKHAASVRSEPGSNSQVHLAVLKPQSEHRPNTQHQPKPALLINKHHSIYPRINQANIHNQLKPNHSQHQAKITSDPNQTQPQPSKKPTPASTISSQHQKDAANLSLPQQI